MTGPADLAKMMQSLKLDPDAAKMFAELKEQNERLAAKNTQLEDELIHLRKSTSMHTEMQARQREKIQELKEQLKDQETELDAAISAQEDYRIEVERLECLDVVDLEEANEAYKEQIKNLTTRIEELQRHIKDEEREADTEMGDYDEGERTVCPDWAAGGVCRYNDFCTKGKHPARGVEAKEAEMNQ
ncbi:hypothetical protein E8E13_008428 [Curvularia kusanoi]|uniref:C3H1-type domain-containing protein n=1 Tax=Curvularia kusanoi TaxID=90978 RepID=A0A9P4TA28_CURKU|nr:hypothetical protein E8E13_008428 [Curvularia kusanoi]